MDSENEDINVLIEKTNISRETLFKIIDYVSDNKDKKNKIKSKSKKVYHLEYKLGSNVQFQDLSSEFVVGIINHEKFKELQIEIGSEDNTIYYRDTPIFSDPRNKRIGARIFSNFSTGTWGWVFRRYEA